MLGAALIALIVPSARWPRFRAPTPTRASGSTRPTTPASTTASVTTRSGPPTCANVFDQEYERFGFAPNGIQSDRGALPQPARPAHAAPDGPEHAGRAQLAGPGPRRLRRPGLEVLGRRLQRAGRDPRHRHPLERRDSLRDEIWLNGGELPLPKHADASSCAAYDCNGDGAFNVDDYANDPRVSGHVRDNDEAAARTPSLDGSDLIAAFSDGDRRGRATATSTTSPAGTSSTTTTTPTTPRATPAPTTTARAAPGRRREEGNDGERRHRRVPALPDRADARLGHVRRRHQQLRPGGALRGRQRHRGRGGRRRRPVQLALRRAARSTTPTATASSSRSSRPTSTPPTTTSRPTTTRRCRCRAQSPTCRASGMDPPPAGASTSSTAAASRCRPTRRSGPGSATPARPSTAATRTS